MHETATARTGSRAERSLARNARRGFLGVLAVCWLLAPAASQDPPPVEAGASANLDATKARAFGAERAGRHAEAARAFLELARLEPRRVRWILAAGRNLGRAGRFNDALDLLEKARVRFPDALDVPALICRTYLLKAESMIARGVRDTNPLFYLEEAARLAEDLLRKAPGHRDARLILAKARFQLGDLDGALEQATEAVRRFPGHQGGHVLLGDVAYQRMIGLRRRLAERGLEPKERKELLELAAAERDRALQAYRTAARIDPTRAYPLVKIGDVLAWNDNVEQALLSYEKALALDPGTPVDHAWIARRADVGRRLKLYERALESYRTRPGADASRAATLEWYVGWTLLAKKAWPEALASFEAALEHNAAFENSHYYAMLAAYWHGDADGAERHAVAYARKNPRGFADVLRALPDAQRDEALGILEFLAQRTHQAKRVGACRDLNHVLAMVRETARHWNNYAFLCRETGRFEESLDAYENALSLDPDDPQLLNDAAVILQYHLPSPENLERARRMYERAISRAREVLDDPESPAERKARARQAWQDAKGNLAKMRKG